MCGREFGVIFFTCSTQVLVLYQFRSRPSRAYQLGERVKVLRKVNMPEEADPTDFYDKDCEKHQYKTEIRKDS
jgi:hypothetical protein